MKTPESFEKNNIKKFLDAIGPDRCWYFCPFMAGYGKSGVGDIVGSLMGAFFSIEVKRPGKNPTAIQKKRMSEIERTNGKAFAGTADQVITDLRAWLAVRGVEV